MLFELRQPRSNSVHEDHRPRKAIGREKRMMPVTPIMQISQEVSMPNRGFREQFEKDGYLVCEGIVSNEQIDPVLEQLDRLKGSKKSFYSQSSHAWCSMRDLSEHGFLNESIQSPSKQHGLGGLRKAVIKLISASAITDELEELTGFHTFVNWQNMLFDKSTGTIEHADTWYLDTDPVGYMVAAWIALEDIEEDAGRFFVIPKSHLLDIPYCDSTKGIEGHKKYARFIKDYCDSRGLTRHAPPLKKGDILFWGSRTIHGSHSQTNGCHSRKSVTAHYHPVGIGRRGCAAQPSEIRNMISHLIKTDNASLFLDNVDPSDFSFYTVPYAKMLVKRLLGIKTLPTYLMNREQVFSEE